MLNSFEFEIQHSGDFTSVRSIRGDRIEERDTALIEKWKRPRNWPLLST